MGKKAKKKEKRRDEQLVVYEVRSTEDNRIIRRFLRYRGAIAYTGEDRGVTESIRIRVYEPVKSQRLT